MILNVLVYQPILDDLYHPNLDDSEDPFIPAKSGCFMCEHRVCYGFEVLKILNKRMYSNLDDFIYTALENRYIQTWMICYKTDNFEGLRGSEIFESTDHSLMVV